MSNGSDGNASDDSGGNASNREQAAGEASSLARCSPPAVWPGS